MESPIYVPGGPNPGGICKCGCGRYTKPAAASSANKGLLKGQAQNYLLHHAAHQVIRDRNTWDERLWSFEDRGHRSLCWIWKGNKDNKWGYGRTQWKGRTRIAHVRAWVEAGNELDTEMHLDHLCRQRACVNPDHLEQVTAAVNARRSTATKLTDVQVREIRKRYSAGGVTQTVLANEYGVRQTTISTIVNGHTWSDI